MIPTELECTKCGKLLPIEDFQNSTQSSAKRFGKQYECRPCKNAFSNKYYKANYKRKVRVKKDSSLKVTEKDYDSSWESVYMSEVSRHFNPNRF